MDYLIIFLLIANITLVVMGFRQLKKVVAKGSATDEPKKKALSPEEKKAKEKREQQMKNFLGYTGDKQ